MIASRTDTYLRNSIRGVHTRLSEPVEKTLSSLFEPFASSIPNLDLLPAMLVLMMEGWVIGAGAPEKRVIEQDLDAANNICGALFTPRSG